MAEHNRYGEWGELVAVDYLREKGYVILDRNWRNLAGREIDIIARKDNLVVFVEVKTRHDEKFVNAADAVTPLKIRHIVSAASSYVKYYRLKLEIRFDIITVVGKEPNPKITHLENAFVVPAYTVHRRR